MPLTVHLHEYLVQVPAPTAGSQSGHTAHFDLCCKQWPEPMLPMAPKGAQPRRAAQYVRMSTEHQRYSTENQSDAIARYAEQRGITASDAGLAVDLRHEGLGAIAALMAPAKPEVA